MILIGVDAACAVSGVGRDIRQRNTGFSADIPKFRRARVPDVDRFSGVLRRIQQLQHELLIVFQVDPGSAQPHID